MSVSGQAAPGRRAPGCRARAVSAVPIIMMLHAAGLLFIALVFTVFMKSGHRLWLPGLVAAIVGVAELAAAAGLLLKNRFSNRAAYALHAVILALGLVTTPQAARSLMFAATLLDAGHAGFWSLVFGLAGGGVSLVVFLLWLGGLVLYPILLSAILIRSLTKDDPDEN